MIVLKRKNNKNKKKQDFYAKYHNYECILDLLKFDK